MNLIDPNVNRVREIRKTVFGKPMREPIARSLEKTHEVLGIGVNKIDEKHDSRVTTMSVTEIPEKPGYFTLGFSRANGE